MDDLKRKEAYHKSRIGQVLIQKGYISEQQLSQALDDEIKDDLRLGERLLERKVISRWQLRRALSIQTRLRFAAFLSVVLVDLVREGQAALTGYSVNPEFTQFLSKNQSLKEVEYNPVNSRLDIHTDGSVCLKVLTNHGELQFDHVRLLLSPGVGYESLTLDDLELSKVTLVRRSIYREGADWPPITASMIQKSL